MVAAVNSIKRMPAWFLTHGAGPLPLLGDRRHTTMVENWKTLAGSLPEKPTSILLVSAHHEEDIPTVTTALRPPMMYDYSNFPPEAYKLKYPAPGNPELAKKVRAALQSAGFESREDPERGYDHGAFVPLMVIFPDADIPVVQLSIMSSLDPKTHIKIGEAISSLRDEGVLILASGGSFHNGRAVMQDHTKTPLLRSQEFDSWLQDTLAGDHTAQDRMQKFADWQQAPYAAYSHPREEHLIPAHVAMGAGRCEKANIIYQGLVLDVACSSYEWW